MASRKYSKPGRLGDVLALIQVLALDPYAHRSMSGLQDELQGQPRSADDWKSVALEHPEFFRVGAGDKHPISLVARHVAPLADGGTRELDVNIIGKLFEAAIELHDREVSRRANWRSAWPTLLGVFVGGLLAVGGSYLTARLQLDNQVVLQQRRSAQDAYSHLMGRKFVTMQLYISRYEALVFSDYHEARWKLAGAPKESLDLQEAQRWMHRSEDLVFEIIKSNQALFEDLGTVRAIFANTAQLRDLVEPLWHLKALKINGPPKGADVDALSHWKEEAVRQVQGLVESEYGKRFDDLLSYLLQQLPAA